MPIASNPAIHNRCDVRNPGHQQQSSKDAPAATRVDEQTSDRYVPRRDDTVAVNPLHSRLTLLCSETKRLDIDALPRLDFTTTRNSALGELCGARTERTVAIEHEQWTFLAYGSCHCNSVPPPKRRGKINR